MTYSFGDGQPALDINGNEIKTEVTPYSVPVLGFDPPHEYGINERSFRDARNGKANLINALYQLEISFVIAGGRFKGVEYQVLQAFVTDCLQKVHPIILYWVEHEMDEDLMVKPEVVFGAEDTNKDILTRLLKYVGEANHQAIVLKRIYDLADPDGMDWVAEEQEALKEAIKLLSGIVKALQRMLSGCIPLSPMDSRDGSIPF